MTKLIEKFIDFGTAVGKVADRSLPSIFSPTSYTPAQVNSEGTDKVSAHLKGIDSKMSDLGGGIAFSDEFFTGNGTQSTYTTTQAFDSSTKLDVFINGIQYEENKGWERSASTNEITIIDDNGDPTNLNDEARLRVRIYTTGAFIDELFSGGQQTYTISQSFGDSTKIDISINGALKEETNDWTRDSSNNQISIVGGALHTDARLRVRIYT